MTTLATVAALLFTATSAFPASLRSSARGTAAAQFLNLGAGARAIALGEAYSAAADDASALHWNPAGLSRIENRAATFTHAAYIDSSFYDYGAYGQNLGNHAWGVGFQYFNAGRVAQTDAAGTDIGGVTPYDIAFSLGYARTLRSADGFSVGLAAKYIRSQLIDAAQTAAVDAGLLSPPYLGDRLRLALTVQNLGGKMRFEREAEELPMAIKAGCAYAVAGRWLGVLDIGFPKHDEPYVAVGAERLIAVRDDLTLAGRVGFNSRVVGSVDGLSGASIGVGLTSRRLALDYAFLPFGGVGLAHHVSLSSKF